MPDQGQLKPPRVLHLRANRPSPRAFHPHTSHTRFASGEWGCSRAGMSMLAVGFEPRVRSARRFVPEGVVAAPILDDLVAAYARAFAAVDDADYRASLLRRFEVASDPRAERYFQLLGTINGWPAQPTLAPLFDWFIRGLHAHPKP